VKNTIWQLDHGTMHPNPKRIHDDDDKILRAADLGLTVEDVVAEGLAFTVLRNPIDRFFSLYKDKILGSGHLQFPPLRSILSTRYGLNPTACAEYEHQRNCHILIDWLEKNLADGIDIKSDPHWTPQSSRKTVISELRLRVLVLDNVSRQMLVLLGAAVPDLSSIVQVSERNRSDEKLLRRSVMDKPISRRVNEVYATDRRWYRHAVDLWSKTVPTSPDQVPRYEPSW